MNNEMMRRWNSLQKMILARKLREDRREKVAEVMNRGLTGVK